MSGSNWVALPDVRECSRHHPRCPGVVGRPSRCPGLVGIPSQMSVSGREALSDVRE